ncbi:panthothenate synthetase [Paraburkholderia antibiotica]|uniref:Panthothenate synthetase n=1 Tax=Paraburkholderia antibiotica TaxID=2728839 RepID=A0A7X9ZXT1_9BURK|nr:panthothenate synthetase [Paraburkholderia antibiotica]NML32392.1 panthothenate synthetase [Paraburkholderia antibiotica]
MRMLLNIRIPNEPFNTLVREGRIGVLMQKILEETRPEAIYFTEQQGKRGAVAVIDIADATAIPALAEPWFLQLNADCELRIAMLPEDLMKAGLDALGDKWK